jgi:hypothetical protein
MMHNAVVRLGRSDAGTQQRQEFLEQLLYLWWESGEGGSLGTPGATKRSGTCLGVKVRPEAACRTCCLDGIIESSNFAKKSMPRRGVATAASKKSKFKVLAEKTDSTAAKTPGGNLLAIGSH